MSAGGMGNDSCGLLDDHEVLIAVNDRDVESLANQFHCPGQREVDRLATLESVAFWLSLAFNQNMTSGDEALGVRARADVGHGGDPDIEPHSGGRLRDD